MVAYGSRFVASWGCIVVAFGGSFVAPWSASAVELAASPAAPATSNLVEWSGKRVAYAEVPALAQKNKFFNEYETLRSTLLGERSETNWTLAQFCGKHGLKEQQRAHLLAVIGSEPNHAGAREALNHKLIDGVWLSPAEQKAHHADKVAAVESARRWEVPLKRIAVDLKAKDPTHIAAALDEIRRIADPGAIPLLEKILSPTRNQQVGLAVVEAVRGMPGKAATMSLARHSTYHNDKLVRESAAEGLRDRSQADFVPPMLGELLTPVESHMSVAEGLGGYTVIQTFTREGEGELQEATAETTVNVRAGATVAAQERAIERIEKTARDRQRAADTENRRTKFVNDRVCSALAIATGEKLDADPTVWWTWWNDKNELYQPEKSVRRKYQSEQITVVAPPIAVRARKSDCLAAGTPIVTARGPVAIETLQIGDLVLSQDPASGTLAYKPVVATTIRPAGVLKRIKTTSGDYLTSGGHPLFVAGRNWEKSRNLKSGDRLRGLEQDSEVTLVEDGPEEQTYNLVVADYHTYFAGPGKILSHDNTLCAPLAIGATNQAAAAP